MRRLFPDPLASITAVDAYRAERRRPVGRPYVAVCMVASIDGSTVLDDVSGGLSGPADVAVLAALRSLADVILVGAGTVRAEGYGPPRKQGQRIAVLSTTGCVDTTTPLFTSGAGLLVLPVNAPAVDVETIRAGVDRVDLPQALGLLDGNLVQAEGGPTLNAALADEDLIDELNVTTSPMLAGGPGPRLLHGATRLAARFELAHVLEDDGFVFSRWIRPRR